MIISNKVTQITCRWSTHILHVLLLAPREVLGRLVSTEFPCQILCKILRFLGQTPSNQREVHTGERNAARMGQHVAPALQQSYTSAPGHEWNANLQPSHARSGNAVSPHNVQEQRHYVRGALGNYRYLPCRHVPALIFNNSSSTSC